MPSRSRALSAALVLVTACAAAEPEGPATLTHVFAWSDTDATHGGFSALLFDDEHAWVLSDRGRLLRASITRDRGGAITRITKDRIIRLKWPPGFDGARDPEGLAQIGDRLYLSAESPARIYRVNRRTGSLTALPAPPGADALGDRSGYEGLAADAAGRLWTVAERGGDSHDFLIFDGARWSAGPSVPADDFAAVGLDFDTEGRLYLLERRVGLPPGFATRLRRIEIDGDTATRTETLLTTRPRTHDNLEGIAVRRADDGATLVELISDDNFYPIQRTEIVTYRVP